MCEMLRRVRRSLLIALLGAAALHAAAESPSKKELKPASVVLLTASRPAALIPIPSRVVEDKRTLLAVTIVAIQNPHDVAFAIRVSIEPRAGSTGIAAPNAKSAQVGVLGVYPVGQPGDYRLDASAALRQSTDASHLCLRLELRALHGKEPLRGLKVTLSSPRWLPVE